MSVASRFFREACMSVTAAFRFIQGTTFDVERAAIGVPGSQVTCQWQGEGTPEEWTWTMVSAPTGSVVPLGVFGMGFTPNAYFTPDIPGGYLVELTVIDPVTGQAVTIQLAFLVPELSGRIIPPFRATPQSLRTAAQVTDLQVQGWHPLMEEWLRFIESGGGGGAAGVDNLLGNQIQRTLTSPFYTLSDKLQFVPGANPWTVIQVGATGQLILRAEARNVALFNEQSGEVDYTVILPNRERPCGMCTDGMDTFIASETGYVYRFSPIFELVATYPGAAPTNPNAVRVEMVSVGGYVFSIFDGPAVWDNTLYRINPSTGVVSTLTVSNPYGMVADSLGRLWVGSENITGTVHVITPATFAQVTFTVGFVNTRPLFSASGKMILSSDGTASLLRYTEALTPASDGTITGFVTQEPAGASYDSVSDTAMVVYGQGSNGVYFIANPGIAAAASANINPGTPISNIRSAVFSTFVGGWIAVDGAVDTSWVITDAPAVSPYLPIAGLLGFAP